MCVCVDGGTDQGLYRATGIIGLVVQNFGRIPRLLLIFSDFCRRGRNVYPGTERVQREERGKVRVFVVCLIPGQFPPILLTARRSLTCAAYSTRNLVYSATRRTGNQVSHLTRVERVGDD